MSGFMVGGVEFSSLGGDNTLPPKKVHSQHLSGSIWFLIAQMLGEGGVPLGLWEYGIITPVIACSRSRQHTSTDIITSPILVTATYAGPPKSPLNPKP